MDEKFEKIRRLAEAYEDSIPIVRVGSGDKHFLMAVPNLKCLGFAVMGFRREPATNDWIAGFQPGEIFFDVGANNGLYGLMAAVLSGCQVHAFEPHFASYYVLTRNIYLNNLQDRMVSYPIAVADSDGCGKMFLSHTMAGKSLNNYGAARPSDEMLSNAVIPQGSVAMSLDRFVALTGIMPNHVKIDVDGIEPQIIQGMDGLLDNSSLKSVMVELFDDNPAQPAVHQRMLGAGFGRFVKDAAGTFYSRS